MFIKNLTPHDITIRTEAGDQVVPASGIVARVSPVEVEAGSVGGVPVVQRTWGAVQGLPEPDGETVFIVSSLVLDQVQGRSDVVAPDTGSTAVRDDAGRIVAVTRFVMGGK